MHKRTAIIVIIMVACMQISIGETATTNADVENVIPEIALIELNGGNDITLTANTTTEIWGSVVVSDDNGCENILGVNSTLFMTSVGTDAPDDKNYHYTSVCIRSDDCTPGGADLTVSYECGYNLTWYAEPTDAGSANEADDWTFRAVAYDSVGSNANTDVKELRTLTAISLEATSINFGVIALNSNTGSVNQNLTIFNHGNEPIDLELSGYGAAPEDGACMICTTGSVNVNYLEYSDMDFSYGAGNDLSATPSAFDFDLNRGTEVLERPSKKIRFGLGFPASGLSGTCSGTLLITAVSDPNLD